MTMIKKLLPFVGILVAALVIVLLIAKGVIVSDHSGECRGDGVYWNNVHYILSLIHISEPTRPY